MAASKMHENELHVDEELVGRLLRGRGWALYGALIALPYYMHTNPPIVASSWHVLDEVLADPA